MKPIVRVMFEALRKETEDICSYCVNNKKCEEETANLSEADFQSYMDNFYTEDQSEKCYDGCLKYFADKANSEN